MIISRAGVGKVKKKYQEYLNNDYKFSRSIMLGIFCLIVVIAGIFGFLYEFVFYYFNSGMTKFYWRGGNFLPPSLTVLI